MAETAVSFVLDQLYELLKEVSSLSGVGSLLSGVHKEFAEIKDELESIQAFLKDADTRAGDEGDTNEGVKVWVKQMREASFRIEDVIDEYIMYLAQRIHHNGFIASLKKIAHLIKTLMVRYQIASEMEDIKLSVRGIKERSERYNFQSSSEDGSSSSRGTKDVKWHDPRMASHFIEEAEVVGFESPRDELIGWLVEGAAGCTVISVVGMGGLGKTTLAKHVFDNQSVKEHFDCRAFITVSQSYTVKGLLKDVLQHFCKDTGEPLPKGMHKMDDKSLIAEVRRYLHSKRYLVLFDDVWKVDFSDEIELAMPNNNKGSRIIITTRMMHVAEFFKKSFPVHVHELQLLASDKAWELFCQKAFRFELDGHCPAELKDMSHEIVQKCKRLPLAIVAIGGLLSTKAKTMFEWQKVIQNLRVELERNAHLTSITRILSLSYDDLPYYLKSCILYFGIYPEDYAITRVRLTRQWIAEGFVKYDGRRTPEEVAEEYLIELIHRSLVLVSSIDFDGKIKRCQVHDLLREVIIRKTKDLSFCHFVHEEDESVSVGTTRRLSISTSSNEALNCLDNQGIRAIYAFGKRKLPETFMGRLPTKFKLLKVLDFEGNLLDHVPNNLGNLFHLKYLNLSQTKVQVLPKSIGKLQNLETLDLTQTLVRMLPSEMNKLTKLRHLCVFYRNYEAGYSMLEFTSGVLMPKGIGCLTSLQDLYYVEVDHGGIDLIQELKRLRQLRILGLRCVKCEHGNALCAAMEEMKQLEDLNITAKTGDDIIDLNFASPPTQLRVLDLKAQLQRLPEWIPGLEYLVKLRLGLSKIIDDPLNSLKNMPSLERLNMWDNAYEGESLHFEAGGFPKLKEVDLTRLEKLNSIVIDQGALLALEQFKLNTIPQLKEVPSGIKHLENLKFLGFADMAAELVQRVDPDNGQDYEVIKHVPVIFLRRKTGPKYHDYEIQTIHSSANV